MGPEPGNSNMSNSHDVPKFESAYDVLQWRHNVSEWVDTIRIASEKGPDKRYKTMFTILGRLLMGQGLPPAQKSIVEEAQAKGRIDFRQDDQIRAVQEIVDLSAVDPPIAMVNRLISSFNKVSSCRRRKQEDLVAFVDRFRGLASKHLIHTGFGTSSHVGEVLAITLINNANLPENTLHNAILQLLSQAQSRADQGEVLVGGATVGFSLIEKIRGVGESLLKTMEPMEIPDEYDDLKSLLQNYRREIKSIADTLALQTARLPEKRGDSKPENIKAISKPPTPRVVLRMDDAVSVLYSLSSATKQTAEMSRTDIEAMVQERVHKALLSYGVGPTETDQRKNPPSSSSGSKKKNKGKSPSLNSSKDKNGNGPERANKLKPVSKGFCWDCGSRDHFRNSKDCKFNGGETFIDKMHRLSKEDPEKKKSSDGFFRGGSTPSNGNQA